MNWQSCVIKEPKHMTSVGAAIRDLLQSGPVAIKIKNHKQTRSEAQNRLLWKWHLELAEHIKECTGNVFSTEDIHEYVVEKLLPKRVVAVKESEPTIIRTRTSKLDTKHFKEFLELYDTWASQTYEVKFTHPDDLYWQAMGISR